MITIAVKTPFRPLPPDIHRGWDIVEKKMLTPPELDAMGFHIMATGKISHPRIITMALTPLLDSSSRRVFEGDICEMGVELEGLGFVKATGWVGWDPSNNHYTVFYNTAMPMLQTGAVLRAVDIKVIGDVFQNPELLEVAAPVVSPRVRERSKCCNAGVEIRGEPGGITEARGCNKCEKACEVLYEILPEPGKTI